MLAYYYYHFAIAKGYDQQYFTDFVQWNFWECAFHAEN